MLANYLSRLQATEKTEEIANIAAADPFQADLYKLQMKDKMLQTLQKASTEKKWQANLYKSDQNSLQVLEQIFLQDRNKIVWVQFGGFQL
jgi:hypothetical protein